MQLTNNFKNHNFTQNMRQI